MRIINFRTFLYTAVTVILGAFSCVLYCLNRTLGLILLLSLIVANIVLFAFYFHKFKYAFGFAASVVVLVCMTVICAVTTTSRHIVTDYEQTHTVTGYVYSVQTEAGSCDMILENITLDGESCAGKMHVSAEVDSSDKLEFLREGYKVAFESKLYKVELSDGNFINTYSTGKDIRYTAYIESAAMQFEVGSHGIFSELRASLQEMLVGFMGEHYGNIAYGMLTGDRSGIDSRTSTYFGIAGIGHVLAVSGLHIGFIIALLSFILRRIPVKIRVLVIFICVFLYAAFAGFSSSVIRAVVMSTIGLVTLVNGQRSDVLNNLSLAFTVLVASYPFALFDASFLMSFSAVFGIACFANTFTRLFKKLRFPRALASAVSVSLSAQIGILPCLMYFFHNLPIYSIIVNIVLMPLISGSFVLLILTCGICLVLPISAPLAVPQSLLIIIDGVAQFIASLPLAQPIVYVSGFIFLLLPLYFIASRYVMLPRFKWVASVCALACGLSVCAATVTTFGMNDVLIPISAYNDVTSIVRKDGKTLLIGDCRNGREILGMLNTYRIGKIDEVYLTSANDSTASSLIYLDNRGMCGAVYCPVDKTSEGIITLLDNGVDVQVFDKTNRLDSVNVEYSESGFVSYCIPIESNKNLIFVSSDFSYGNLDRDILNKAAVLRCKLFTGYLDDRVYLTNFSAESVNIENKYVYPVIEIGTYIFDYMNGKIYI